MMQYLIFREIIEVYEQHYPHKSRLSDRLKQGATNGGPHLEDDPRVLDYSEKLRVLIMECLMWEPCTFDALHLYTYPLCLIDS